MPATLFFRFPGFVSTPPLLDWLTRRGIVVFGADVSASDWTRMSPIGSCGLRSRVCRRTMAGILLLHDTKAQTAAMLPRLSRELKARNFQVVHTIATADSPASGPATEH